MPSIKPVTATDVIEPAIACDPLLRNVELPLREIYYPLGFAVEVITNAVGSPRPSQSRLSSSA
jgi:hypothetical protein